MQTYSGMTLALPLAAALCLALPMAGAQTMPATAAVPAVVAPAEPAAASAVEATPTPVPAAPANDKRIGTFKQVKGESWLGKPDARRPAASGDGVLETERVSTGQQGAATITLKDGTVLTMGPNSTMDLSQFKYDATTQKGHFALDLVWPWIVRMGWQPAFENIQALFVAHGLLFVFIAGFTPIPYKVFTIASGSLGVGLLPFVVGSLLGRGMRFFLVAGLMACFSFAPTAARVMAIAALGFHVPTALFQTRTRNEIVTQTSLGGRATFQNAGATRRQGLMVAVLLSFSFLFGEFVFANLLVGTRYETLQVYLNNMRNSSGHFNSALVISYFAFVLVLTWVANRLNKDKT